METMNIRKTPKSAFVLMSGILVLLVLACSAVKVQAEQTEKTEEPLKIQADRAWEELKKSWGFSRGADQEEVKAYKSGKMSQLEILKFNDRQFKKNSQLAEAIWDNYPQDERRDKAMYAFFQTMAHPNFIAEEIPDELVKQWADLPWKEFKAHKCQVPIDHRARERWLNKGDEMVATVVNSNASLKRKEAAEFVSLSRDFRIAKRLYFNLRGTREDPLEEEYYWPYFAEKYWQHLRLRLDNHVEKYAELEVVAGRVENLLSILQSQLPSLMEKYWRHFFEATDGNNPLADKAGVVALHNTAARHLDVLVTKSGEAAIDMTFTAMDGKTVDVSKLRGKVVLIDFWATWCKPCVAEMPHLASLYKKYRKHGFEIVGIALDEASARERVLEITRKNNATWPQRFEGKGYSGDSYMQLYGIGSLPTVWLLDKEGKIVDHKARGKKLEPLIRKYLGLSEIAQKESEHD